jgi:hypothetical protein
LLGGRLEKHMNAESGDRLLRYRRLTNLMSNASRKIGLYTWGNVLSGFKGGISGLFKQR